jgi:hypothetical protein
MDDVANRACSQDTELLPLDRFPIKVLHTFPVKPFQRFLCQEDLYVSDHSRESHYRKNHPKNHGMHCTFEVNKRPNSDFLVLTRTICSGAEVAGSIVVDMTFLRTEGHIQPTIPKDGWPGKKHYKVEFELVMIVDGRNLRYEARWPIGEGSQVQQKGQTCIAAAFIPGTK